MPPQDEQIAAAIEVLRRCIQHREDGRPEAVLRSELTSRLRGMFPGEDWVDRYTAGEEAAVTIETAEGAATHRFVDNLVDATVIEYEPDLRIAARAAGGLAQVRENVAGAIRSGIPASQVRGVLSDTLEWHAYDVTLGEGVDARECRAEEVELREIDSLDLTAPDSPNGERLYEFLKKHLARERSRPLTSANIATDLGLESRAFSRQVEAFMALVTDARDNDSSAQLATELWSGFVDHLETAVAGFRPDAFVDEAYITLMARLLCANVLRGEAFLSDDDELLDILTGQFFADHFHLANLVERDYFGWMLGEQHRARILELAREIQRDLYAYDYAHVHEQDLFGHLMAQLARRSRRRMLGQEWTPQWVARVLAEAALSMVDPNDARFIDPCCGSGAIMAEVLKAARRDAGLDEIDSLQHIITGFDIDPLAVLLAKATWVITLKQEVRDATAQIVIPVYHADSLFAITPLTRDLPIFGTAGDVPVDLDGQTVILPRELMQPELSQVFDTGVDWAYDEACAAQDAGNVDGITEERTKEFIEGVFARFGVNLPDVVSASITTAMHQLVSRMAELAVAGRNEIWAFVLRNTYRPALLAGQFNGLVSNPPWLAMSQFADNPYKEKLSERSLAYGIKPAGAAHLHLELATVHLLHAVDRYLSVGSAVACLVPGTVVNGQQHAKLRDGSYLTAGRPVPFEIQEVWEIARGTFKVRAIAVVGKKKQDTGDVQLPPTIGRIATRDGLLESTFEQRHLGTRTAWIIGGTAGGDLLGGGAVPPQGADLMPRPAVCVKVTQEDGTEWRVTTPEIGDTDYFAVKGAKKLAGQRFAGMAAPAFVHRMVQSLNLLPFVIDDHFARIAMPARRGDDGGWEILTPAEIRASGLVQTARRFGRINSAMALDGVVKPLEQKIDERNKLTRQVFAADQYLVVNPTGGSIACAALLSTNESRDIVVDQTLYWSLVTSEAEAWYRVGLMNTDVLTQAITAFNPEGELGPRHLHTLPNRVSPAFDPTDPDHVEVSALAAQLGAHAREYMDDDAYIRAPERSIASRRRRLRLKLKELPEFMALEGAATAVLSGVR